MFWTAVFTISIAQGVFLLFLLLSLGSKNSTATRLIATVVFAMVLTNLDYLLVTTEIYRSTPYLFGIGFGMMFLFGPLFYFYARSVTDTLFTWKPKYFLHFIPYLLNVFLNIPFFLIDAPSKIALIDSFVSGTLAFRIFDAVLISVQSAHLGFYLFLTLRRLNSIELTYGNMSFIVSMNKRVAWLKSMFICFAGFLLTIIGIFVFVLANQRFILEANYIYTVITAAIIYFIAYKLVLNPELINPDFEKKYKSYKPLDVTTENNHLRRLDTLLKDQKIYLNPDLKLADLALELGLSSHLASKLINEKLGKSFNDLVNEHRVEEFISRTNDPQYSNQSILGIAYDVGFNSKSSFNSIVKKITGRTPSELKEFGKIVEQGRT